MSGLEKAIERLRAYEGKGKDVWLAFEKQVMEQVGGKCFARMPDDGRMAPIFERVGRVHKVGNCHYAVAAIKEWLAGGYSELDLHNEERAEIPAPVFDTMLRKAGDMLMGKALYRAPTDNQGGTRHGREREQDRGEARRRGRHHGPVRD